MGHNERNLDEEKRFNSCQTSDDCNSKPWQPWNVPPKSCLECEATYKDGVLEGDESNFFIIFSTQSFSYQSWLKDER